MYVQADKLQSLITAAKVPDVEPIWTTLFAKALEGKDVKDLLLNVGSGGGAAAAPAAGGAAAGGAAAEADAPAAEEKKEGTFILPMAIMVVDKVTWMLMLRREGGVRGRGHGIRPFRLSARLPRRRRQRDEDEGDDDDVSLSVAFGVAEFHCYGSGLNASLSLHHASRLISCVAASRLLRLCLLPDMPVLRKCFLCVCLSSRNFQKAYCFTLSS